MYCCFFFFAETYLDWPFLKLINLDKLVPKLIWTLFQLIYIVYTYLSLCIRPYSSERLNRRRGGKIRKKLGYGSLKSKVVLWRWHMPHSVVSVAPAGFRFEGNILRGRPWWDAEELSQICQKFLKKIYKMHYCSL